MTYTQEELDLIPTHHENEIAQSKGRTGKIPANYWLHGEYLLINGGKMSKSLGNVYLLKDIKEKGMTHLYINYLLLMPLQKQTKLYMGRNRSNIKIIRKIKKCISDTFTRK